MGYLYSLYCLEKPSEKPRTHQRRSPMGRRKGIFRPILPSVYPPNSRLEHCSNPFSDSFRRNVLGNPHSPDPEGQARHPVLSLGRTYLYRRRRTTRWITEVDNRYASSSSWDQNNSDLPSSNQTLNAG